MHIHQAVLKLKAIEEIGKQLEHLRSEAAGTTNWEDYATDCNAKAQELARMLYKGFIEPADIEDFVI